MALANLSNRPSIEQVRATVAYDEGRGVLIWLVTRGRAIAGNEAGGVDKSTGYKRVNICGHSLMVTHVVHALKTGKWPERVDHRFGDKSDAKWEDLRTCTQSENRANTGKPSNNTSGYKGVTLHALTGKWAAQIGVGGKTKWLGLFDTREAAAKAYAAAAKEIYGEFARTDDFVVVPPQIPVPPPRPTGRPTYQDVADVLSYDPETGEIRWKKALGFRGKVGELAGRIGVDGYVRVGLWGRQYPGHHIAYLLMTGYWVNGQIDHKDLNRANNKFNNIRPSNQSQNIANTPKNKRNTSGYKGVSEVKERGTWAAYIKENGKSRRIGEFSTPQEAHEAYCAAAKIAFGEFARFE